MGSEILGLAMTRVFNYSGHGTLGDQATYPIIRRNFQLIFKIKFYFYPWKIFLLLRVVKTKTLHEK